MKLLGVGPIEAVLIIFITAYLFGIQRLIRWIAKH
jgi:hypothetical protein